MMNAIEEIDDDECDCIKGSPSELLYKVGGTSLDYAFDVANA